MRQIDAAPSAASEQRAHRTSRESEPTAGFFGRWGAAILIPAAAVLALATILLWTENIRLDRQLAEQRAAIEAQQKQLDEARHTVDLMSAKDTVTVALASRPGMPKGAVHVMYNAKMGMLMCDGWVEPAPKDKSYQLWLVPMDGKPISAGVLSAPSGPIDHWMMKLPQGVAAKAFAVTLEPSGGMPQPTGPMVLVGPVT